MTPADLADVIVSVVREAVADGVIDVTVPATVPVERPKNPEHGDYATPAALQLAKAARRPPREIAELLAERLRKDPGVASVDVAGPGFLNFRLASEALGELARAVVRAGDAYGRAARRKDRRVNVEFVSANPTGPVTLASTRWAAVGDALARVFDAAGYDVGTEYYVNDAGVQVQRFGASVLAAAKGEPTPDDGYHGAYVAEIAAKVLADNPGLLEGDEAAALAVATRDGLAQMLAEITSTLAGFGVHYDVWKSERSLHDAGDLTAAVADLRAHGHVYDAEGAVFLRTTDFGDDKDRALVKSDGQPTYFCGDAAYYRDKRRRGFDKVVMLLGADHHGYIGRLRALAACYGDDPAETLDVIIGQLVTLSRGGEPVKMSKRAGNFLTLADLVDVVGVDAARYSLVRSSLDSSLDLDLDLIARQAPENPVFYVQYAHTRVCGVLRNAAQLGIATGDGASAPDGVDVSLLSHPREVDLLRALGELPTVVAAAASLRAPHRVARYLEELAGTYHRFYDACRVLPQGDEEPTPLTGARLLLVEATKVVLANGLRMLGVSAPERM
ncbi:arginine--tRNA ligase [Frankia sp. CNm7]|uniref:Arginine--tRNA ligase n=1 Tax=Frankia nepalensis TaxID=1836974 RepID=A0A937RHR1_9ACTN|nr:arginine--tRNA ligase [Frankia nepalensis]MBL7499730.1 arginine--tRNA ligase [Frankia nepalensis]MBL7510912.1 arginine--tRNA ligase [Frankia nepalensis]MBL7522805.1 arginine--tRNA ligase [Frankia nepalensis]MBL7630412.1 arginine--tRNA ligase [Frankia nepalensis]